MSCGGTTCVKQTQRSSAVACTSSRSVCRPEEACGIALLLAAWRAMHVHVDCAAAAPSIPALKDRHTGPDTNSSAAEHGPISPPLWPHRCSGSCGGRSRTLPLWRTAACSSTRSPTSGPRPPSSRSCTASLTTQSCAAWCWQTSWALTTRNAPTSRAGARCPSSAPEWAAGMRCAALWRVPAGATTRRSQGNLHATKHALLCAVHCRPALTSSARPRRRPACRPCFQMWPQSPSTP